MLCEKCHEQEATVHITKIFGDTGDTKKQDFCEACAADSEGVTGLKDGGTCDYCSLPAVCVSTAFAIPGVMDEETDRWCELCSSDFAEFDAKQENQLPDIDVGDAVALESSRELRLAIQKRREAFIRQRVRERRQ
jgi:protein-arginine kinase activator protein McsA